MGREGETPAQIFWHIGVQKKWYKLSKLGGGGEGCWGNLDKIQKSSYFFFRETFPKANNPVKSFYWLQVQESTLCNLNFQKKSGTACFVKKMQIFSKFCFLVE